MSERGGSGDGICILSFGMLLFIRSGAERRRLTSYADSGGPGTYSQLLILKEYMNRLANDLCVSEDDVYPADYFDLMGGVGFGGYGYQ
jgi:hypothetical protein